MSKVFNFETVHDTAKRTMIQTLEPFTVIVDWANENVRVMKNNNVIGEVDFKDGGFTISDYERLLTEVEKSVEQLKGFQS